MISALIGFCIGAVIGTMMIVVISLATVKEERKVSKTDIKALAKAYGKDPDEILRWQYGKVFGILYTDLEERKFEKKYQQQINGKSRSHKYNA